MLIAVIACFIIGYILIVFEHQLRLDKTVPALLMGALCWAFISLGNLDLINYLHEPETMDSVLLHHIGKIAEILLFLMGAMTIVELIDMHKGFAVITNKIGASSKIKMLWIICGLAFILSATLDNLAATIVLVSLLRRLVPDKIERLWFISLAVISANAGGAWSPIGDVTTTMLWIGKKVSTVGLISHIVLPSIVCIVVPLIIAGFLKPFKGKITQPEHMLVLGSKTELLLSSRTMLSVGIGALIFVPVFKTITHLPPYMGMMLSLGFVWLVSEYIKPEKVMTVEKKALYSAHKALSRIELSSILFFLGILAAVASLESLGLLNALADKLDDSIPSTNIVIMILGVASAIVDNVPLVAAAMGMYNYPMDNPIWHFIAFAAGTGGSMLIIGSAAGVAAMGMEKINFIWYFKNITWLAFAGFLAGSIVFILTKNII
jgi:Na+/H+ antiporter NhaD/arsenite permease-like protein